MVSGICGGQTGLDASALWQDLLKKADKDGDGKITKAEFKAAAPKGASESTVDKVFDSTDTNQDGVVSAEEYAAAMQKKNLTAQLSSQEGFSALV